MRDQFAIKEPSPPAPSRGGRPTKGPYKRFILGPIPLDWVAEAGRLPGKSLQVAMMLLYQDGLEKSETLTIPKKVAERFGVKRDAMNRALAALEGAGLVSLQKRPGQRPRVALLLPDA